MEGNFRVAISSVNHINENVRGEQTTLYKILSSNIHSRYMCYKDVKNAIYQQEHSITGGDICNMINMDQEMFNERFGTTEEKRRKTKKKGEPFGNILLRLFLNVTENPNFCTSDDAFVNFVKLCARLFPEKIKLHKLPEKYWPDDNEESDEDIDFID